MKKVFFGVLLAMADLATWVMMLMLFLPIGQQVSLVFGLVAGLCSALGYWLIMRGAEELPQTQFWYYAGLFSKILCAYTAAMTILDAVQQLGLFTLHLPAMVENILYYVTDLGSFFVMYFCVLGVRDLQYVARKNLFAGEIYKCFTLNSIGKIKNYFSSDDLYSVCIVSRALINFCGFVVSGFADEYFISLCIIAITILEIVCACLNSDLGFCFENVSKLCSYSSFKVFCLVSGNYLYGVISVYKQRKYIIGKM